MITFSLNHCRYLFILKWFLFIFLGLLLRICIGSADCADWSSLLHFPVIHLVNMLMVNYSNIWPTFLYKAYFLIFEFLTFCGEKIFEFVFVDDILCWFDRTILHQVLCIICTRGYLQLFKVLFLNFLGVLNFDLRRDHSKVFGTICTPSFLFERFGFLFILVRHS